MIKILFFASLKERLAVNSLDFSASEPLTVADLIVALAEQQNATWRDILGEQDILVAVNQTIVPREFVVSPGNEVAFFPPVTGG